MIFPGQVQRVDIVLLIEGRHIRDTAAAEGSTIERARHHFSVAMTSFESIVAKAEGPEQTMVERSFVLMIRCVIADRDAPAFMMRKAAAEIDCLLLPEMHDAIA